MIKINSRLIFNNISLLGDVSNINKEWIILISVGLLIIKKKNIYIANKPHFT